MGKIYQNDVGVLLHVATKIALTGGTNMSLSVKKPSGKIVTWAPVSINLVDPTIMDYTTIAGDLDEFGRYYLQANVTFNTQVLKGETAPFDIMGPFQ